MALSPPCRSLLRARLIHTGVTARQVPARALQMQEDVVRGVLSVNDAAATTSTDSGEWLRSAPRGAYTTARTVHRTTVFDLTFHVNRLAETARLMCEQPTQSIDGSNGSSNARTHLPEELLSAETLRPLVVQALRSAIGHFETACPQHEGELKLTVLTHGEGDRPNVCAHVSPLPPRPAPPVKVQVRGHPRTNAAAKDSEWVRERQQLEELKPPDVNEIVLATPDGDILEGMSSNILVVQGGAVYTAREGVLLGTVRDIILSVCRNNGIPVVEKPPRLQDIDSWEGCIVSSTSRLSLPVAEVQVVDSADDGNLSVRQLPTDGLVARIDQLVLGAIEAASEPL